jgi:hypothetical protein
MMFAGICSIVMGIVLLCVFMGGYTSLLRAKNRIFAAKGIWADECEKRSAMVKKLASMAQEAGSFQNADPALDHVKGAADVLIQVRQIKTPLPEELIVDFTASQTRLTRDIGLLVRELDKNPPIEKSKGYRDLIKNITGHQDIVAYAGRRYNKEVRYFNHRKSIFPGFLVAKWFGLDEMTFPEMATDIFKAVEPDPAQNTAQ